MNENYPKAVIKLKITNDSLKRFYPKKILKNRSTEIFCIQDR